MATVIEQVATAVSRVDFVADRVRERHLRDFASCIGLLCAPQPGDLSGAARRIAFGQGAGRGVPSDGCRLRFARLSVDVQGLVPRA